MIAWSQSLTGAAGRVRLALTDRDGGVSVGPWGAAAGGGLNLATHVDDDPAAVTANRQRLCTELAVPPDALVVADQVHGRDVVQVSGPCPQPPEADALVTDRPGLVLTVLVADCVPVLLADAERGVVGVAHAGRPGMVAGVVGAAVTAMRDLGARTLVARLGPSVCPRCYEVPLAMREDVAARRPETRSLTWDARPSVDVAAGVLAQLSELGVGVRQLPGCTVESDRLYSYRRDGLTGRFAGLAWLEEAA
ncbi:MAG TPA: peptidoglycan editing factor PgeF [Angustibacter sp.]|nr:peptidoglycan editing factor PgeF [Angustibacter sp.]